MIIGGYFINDYWWLFYLWLLVIIVLMVVGDYFIDVYWRILVIILLVDISGYWWLLVAIGGYWWLLVDILLMVIDGYSIVSH